MISFLKKTNGSSSSNEEDDKNSNKIDQKGNSCFFCYFKYLKLKYTCNWIKKEKPITTLKIWMKINQII